MKPLLSKWVIAASLCTVCSALAEEPGMREQHQSVPKELIAPPFLAVENDRAIWTEIKENGEEIIVPSPTVTQAPPPSTISVMPVSHISLDTLGVFNASASGIPFDVWKGSTQANVQDLLEQQRHLLPSAVMRDLLARLLLTSTQPPEAANIQQHSFRARIEALLHLGEVSQALRLLELVPAEQKSEAIAMQHYLAQILSGDVAWVCKHIGSALKSYDAIPQFWQRLSVYCLANQGKKAEMQLALEAMREQGLSLPEAFVELVENMGQDAVQKTQLHEPISMDMAALFAISGKNGLPESYIKHAPLPILTMIGKQKGFPDFIKEAAEERLQQAVATGQGSKALRQWFTAVFVRVPQKPVSVDLLMRELQKKQNAKDIPITRLSYRMYHLLDALDFSAVQMDADTGLFSTAHQVSPALLGALEQATAQARTGEALLLAALVTAQGGDLAVLDDVALGQIVRSLAALGFMQEARALAAEAMVSLL